MRRARIPRAVVCSVLGATLLLTVVGASVLRLPRLSTTHAASSCPVPTTDGTVEWNGDFSTGDFSQYKPGGLEENGHWSVVSSPAPVGCPFSGKFEVYPNSTTGSHSRAEKGISQATTGGYEGQTWYYTWMMYFPSNPDATNGWSDHFNNLVQWIDTNPRCSPALSVGITLPAQTHSTTPYLQVINTPDDTNNSCAPFSPGRSWNVAPLQYDTWYTITMLVKFSTNASVGYAEAWLDGAQVLPLTRMQTIENNGDYMEIHNYQGAVNPHSVVYFGAIRRHSCYAQGPCVVPTTFYRMEAESMTLVGGASVYWDPAASGAHAVAAWTNGAGVSGGASFATSDTYTFTFGGREDSYSGNAHLSLYLDGSSTAAGGVDVTNASGYPAYTISASVAAGTHSFRLVFDNDAYGTVGDRNAYIDYVSITSPAGTNAPTPAATPTQTPLPPATDTSGAANTPLPSATQPARRPRSTPWPRPPQRPAPQHRARPPR